ncbi:MAG TPA: hypothetical protein VIM71_04085 [Lacunisphaera sp.]
MKLLTAFLCLGVFGRLFGAEPKDSFTFIDDYLAKWNRFAQGDESLVPFLRDNTEKFEVSLAAALRAGDNRAVSRVVFYTVVQVGGFIDIESPLGKEVTKVFGQLPVTKGKKGEKLIFAGDLYFWWKQKHAEYPAFSQYDEWEKTDFAREVPIPMYEKIHAQPKKEG